jgi:hypothetical protein
MVRVIECNVVTEEREREREREKEQERDWLSAGFEGKDHILKYASIPQKLEKMKERILP